MDDSFVAASPDAVRGLIASLVLGESAALRQLGEVRLAPHQIEAVSRVEDAFNEFGGALLCDVVGSGKTYVGLAVAAKTSNSLIVVPAGLRPMWKAAMSAAQVDARIVTIESLSRSEADPAGSEIIIVDEAHHFRNRSNQRYRRLASLIGERPALLMTATPIHNSRRDLDNLLSLFIGERAQTLSETEIARLIIRRGKKTIAGSAPIPTVQRTDWLTIGDDPEIAAGVMDLPAAVPARGSGTADGLASHGLLRQWASSEAALVSALKRRLLRARAMESSLESGDYPSEQELRGWIVGDDAIQLGFAGLLSPAVTPDAQELIACVRAHAAALRRLAKSLESPRTLDTKRAGVLRELKSGHPGEMIVAFASYEATVMRLFELLKSSIRVAALTANGGRLAAGRATRAEIIEQFAPHRRTPRPAERIELLLTTDLLSEGVNLQRASVVVHLDLPWTAARIDQRIGRLARVGSPHTHVSGYGFRPPASAERILRGSLLVDRKWRIASSTIGSDFDLHLDPTQRIDGAPAPEIDESIRAILTRWTTAGPDSESGPVVTAVNSECAGFLALVQRADAVQLIAERAGRISGSPSDTLNATRAANGPTADCDPIQAAAALHRIRRWMRIRESADVVGLGRWRFLRARRRVLDRVDSIAAAMPPHQRHSRAALIASARAAATRNHSRATEDRIQQLVRGENVGDREWLEELARLPARALQSNAENATWRIRALILFVPSTPPPSS